MFIKSIQIIHFKSFKDVTIHFNAGLNLFTGVNNSGKTTVLEATALWHECFNKLLMQARMGRTGKKATTYKKGEYILGNTEVRYFSFDEINSVRSPNFKDIFHQKETNTPIQLIVKLQQINEKLNIKEEIEIGFQIKKSNLNYDITLIGFQNYSFQKFNDFFEKFPNPINIYYASPVSAVLQMEHFVTLPQIKDAILRRNSANVLRNRLYLLYQTALFQNYMSELNYILFDNQSENLIFSTQSNFQEDTHVVFEFTLGGKDMIKKDIALLGSGTLQIAEILLNVHQRSNKTDMDLILLDEPDSYIHRSIQLRLLEILTRHSGKNQIFITTHNEAMIRAATTEQLFHIEPKSENIYQSIDNQRLIPLIKTGDKRFKGIYPIATNTVIRSLGNSTGLDFINAIESDRILFVEGEDDAQALYILLQQAVIPKNTKKYVFWVVNGITNVFKEINMYKTLFSQIKNEKSLWDKSVLIMDRDFLSDEHVFRIAQKMKEKLALPTYIMDAYTLETSLLTDFNKLSRLLTKWVDNKHDEKIDSYSLEKQINRAYNEMKTVLETKYLNDIWKVNATQRYIDVRDKTNLLFGKGHSVIDQNDPKLTLYHQKYLEDSIQRYDFYKLMNKFEVEKVINNALSSYNYVFDIEKDFIFLLAGVDRSTWMTAWDFLIELSR